MLDNDIIRKRVNETPFTDTETKFSQQLFSLFFYYIFYMIHYVFLFHILVAYFQNSVRLLAVKSTFCISEEFQDYIDETKYRRTALKIHFAFGDRTFRNVPSAQVQLVNVCRNFLRDETVLKYLDDNTIVIFRPNSVIVTCVDFDNSEL